MKPITFLPLAAALALLVNQATAAVFTWDGGGNSNINNPANWVGDVSPGSTLTADIIFTGTIQTSPVFNPTTNWTWNSISFNGDANFTINYNANAGILGTAGGGITATAPGTTLRTYSILDEFRVTANQTWTTSNQYSALVVNQAIGNLALGANTLTLDTFNHADATIRIGSAISGSGGSIVKSGGGTAILSGTNTYTGTTTIKNGTLALDGAANRLAVAGAVVLGDTGTTGKLVLGGTTTAGQTLTALTTTGLGGSVVGGNAANSTLTLNIASSNTFAGTLGGGGTNENNLALTKTGVGTLTLSNTANTFTGQVLSDSGTIQVTKLENNGTASSVGSGTGSIRLGSDATATLEYIGTTDSTTNKVIQIGTNTDTNTGSATILNNSTTGKLTFTATTLNANPAATVARALTLGGTYTGAANEIQGIIRDNNTAGGGIVSLTKEGASTWALSGANTYTGATLISGGSLQLGAGGTTGRLTATSSITNNGNLTINRSDAFSQATDLGAGVAITGTGSFTQAGSGTTTLTVDNTYAGGTTVSAGTLQVNNTSGSGTGSGTVTVDATLKGDGSITAAANNYVYLNGTLQVGQTGATVGQDFSLTTSGAGSTIFGASSLLSFDLWTTTGTDQTGTLAAADVLRLFGDVSIAGTSLLKLGNPNALTFQPGDMFKVFDWAGLGTLTGTFATDFSDITLTPGTYIDSSNLYTTGIISIASVPEPSRAMLLATGTLGLLLRRRRK